MMGKFRVERFKRRLIITLLFSLQQNAMLSNPRVPNTKEYLKTLNKGSNGDYEDLLCNFYAVFHTTCFTPRVPHHFSAALCTKSLQLLIQFNLFYKGNSFYLFNAIFSIDVNFFVFIQS